MAKGSNGKGDPAIPSPSSSLRKRRLSPRSLLDSSIKGILLFCAFFSIIALGFIVFFLFKEAVPIITQENFIFYRTDYGYWKAPILDMLQGETWRPVSNNNPMYGVKPLIVGSLMVTAGSMIIAIPLGLGCAIFISQLAPSWIRDKLKTAVELLAGVPSVVYGLFGLIVLVRWIKVGFDQPTGESVLAGSIILGVMALPTIISVAEDAISSVTRDIKEASLALGATKWQTISQIVVPASISGITAGIILGMGRAMGETMAVMMVTGNTAIIPDPAYDIFSTVKTLTGTIGIEMGEATGDHQSALFFLAVLLFFLVLGINSIAVYIMGKIKAKHLGLAKPSRLKEMIPENVIIWGSHAIKIAGVLVFLFLLTEWFGFLAGLVIIGMVVTIYLLMKLLKPKAGQYVAYGVVSLAMLATIGALVIIFYYIISEGIGSLISKTDYGYWTPPWWFLLRAPEDQGVGGGIFPAIVGTFYLVVGAILIAMPLGVGAGIYLSEYAKEGRLLRTIRLGIDNLNGTPSIVFGLFAFAFLVIYLDFGISLITGIIILSIMVLPTIIRTTEESLKSVPHSMREGSLALGSTKWETIWKVVLPPSLPGIITGIILSIGRAAGETAPILFTATAFITPSPVDDLFEPTMALSTHIFILANEETGGMPNASGTALVLLIIIFIVYASASYLRRRFKDRIKW